MYFFSIFSLCSCVFLWIIKSETILIRKAMEYMWEFENPCIRKIPFSETILINIHSIIIRIQILLLKHKYRHQWLRRYFFGYKLVLAPRIVKEQKDIFWSIAEQNENAFRNRELGQNTYINVFWSNLMLPALLCKMWIGHDFAHDENHYTTTLFIKYIYYQHCNFYL